MIVGCIIQARMSSQRLPEKVAADICGEPMLRRVVERVGFSTTVDVIVVATSVESEDDEVERIARGLGDQRVRVFRGSLDDVLDRFYQAAKREGLDVIVRVTADCPLIDWKLIDRLVGLFFKGGYEYVSNVTGRRTFPRGLDVEVLSFKVLERMWRESVLPREREHVTTMIREHPEQYRIGSLLNDTDLSRHRWTVDTPEDLEFVREVYAGLSGKGACFTTADVLGLLAKRPGLSAINASVEQKRNLEGDTN